MMHAYRVTCLFDGWRIDTHEVRASSATVAKRKVRRKYRRPRSVTEMNITRTG